MIDDEALRAKWERLAANHPDQQVRERARQVLFDIGGEAQPGPYREGLQASRTPVDPLDAALRKRAAAGTPSRAPEPPDNSRPFADDEELIGKKAGWSDRLTARIVNAVTGKPGGTERMIRDLDREMKSDPEGDSARITRLGQEVQALGPRLGASLAAPELLLASGPVRALALAGRGASGLGRAVGVGAAEGAVGGATGSVAGDLVTGDTKGMGGRAVESGAIGSALGSGSELLRAGVRKLSPWVRKFGEASDSGLMEGAEKLPSGRAGTIKASENTRDAIFARDKELMSEAGSRYAAATAPELKKSVDPEAVRAELMKAWKSNTVPSTGAPIDEALDTQLQSYMAKLGDSPTVEDVLALRRSVQEAAGMGAKDPSDHQRVMRKVYDAFRVGAREASPAVASADDAYSSAKDLSTRRKDILGVKKGVGSAAAQRRAAAALEYLGDDSVPALQRAGQLEELAAQDPQIGSAMKSLEAKKALEATRLFTLTPQPRTGLSDAVADIPVVGRGLGLARQYGRGLGRIADQAVVPEMKSAANAAPFFANPLDALMYRLKQQKEKR